MLMVMDVGNTNITLGVFDGNELIATFRMTTKIPRTSDEYGIIIRDMLVHTPINRKICQSKEEASGNSSNSLADGYIQECNDVGIHVKDIQAVIISSVVPNVMHSLTSAIIKYFQITPIIVGPGTKTGIRIATENPRQIGADRIVDAVGGYMLYGGPVIVIDYGTATTYDLVSENGSFEAGVIVPGIRTSVKTLWEDAAKLPEIEIRKPKSILAKETITSMQAGLVYGQIGQTEYIISHIKQESGYSNIKVVATGGLGKLIASETNYIDIYDPNLTLHGMRLIYEKQK